MKTLVQEKILTQDSVSIQTGELVYVLLPNYEIVRMYYLGNAFVPHYCLLTPDGVIRAAHPLSSIFYYPDKAYKASGGHSTLVEQDHVRIRNIVLQ